MMKVVQCWDDGVINDIRLTELLRKYDAKATFNLNPGLMENRTENYWMKYGDCGWSFHGFRAGKLSFKEVEKIYKGFQLASHCWKHENAGSIPDDEWIESAMRARRAVEEITQQECLGFAYPCGIATEASIRLLRENGFAYGRTTKYVEDVTSNTEPMALATNCHFMAPNFLQLYNKAKENGHKAFYFWGHSYEMYEYDELWNQFENKIKYITKDPDSEWANVTDIIPLMGNK